MNTGLNFLHQFQFIMLLPGNLKLKERRIELSEKNGRKEGKGERNVGKNDKSGGMKYVINFSEKKKIFWYEGTFINRTQVYSEIDLY